MVEIVILLAAIIILRRQLAAMDNGAPITGPGALVPRRVSPRLASLVNYADRLYAEKKWLAAEKAYLGVLKLDHKNITAYTHLGVIYSTQKNLPDAIECFQIAARLRPSGTTYQNLGLAYYENRNYMKAIATFDKAIMFEPTVHRYLALSRSYKKISDTAHRITALERAVELEANTLTLHLLAEVYEDAGRQEDALAVYRRIHAQNPEDALAARKTQAAPVAEPAQA